MREKPQSLRRSGVRPSAEGCEPPGEQGEAQDDGGETTRTLWALSVPELYDLQNHAGGLNVDDYERWLGDLLLVAALIES